MRNLQSALQALVAQRSQIDRKIGELEGILRGLGSLAVVRRGPGRPPGSGRGPGRPPGSGRGPGRPRGSGRRGGGPREGSLKDVILKVLSNAGEPMKVADISDAVLKSGYSTKNKTLAKSVGIALAGMDGVKKVGRGLYRIA
jgi:hypothetical protein